MNYAAEYFRRRCEETERRIEELVKEELKRMDDPSYARKMEKLEAQSEEERRKREQEIKKREVSDNPGEKAVEYAIKWFMLANDRYVVGIKKDCETQYRYNCIALHKPEIIDEPQEYDHILICPAGIILIETKHWKGRVEIRQDGKWLRSYEDISDEGIESPRFQMRRHEILMQKICPSVTVHSLLCFSNASIVIDGRENFTYCPIVTTEQLEEVLSDLCAKGSCSKEEIDKMADTINKHKVYKPKKND